MKIKSRHQKVSVDLEKVGTQKISGSHDQHMKECDLDFDLKDVARDQKACTSKKHRRSQNTPRDQKSKNGCPIFRKFSILVLKSRPWAKKLGEKILVLKSTLTKNS